MTAPKLSQRIYELIDKWNHSPKVDQKICAFELYPLKEKAEALEAEVEKLRQENKAYRKGAELQAGIDWYEAHKLAVERAVAAEARLGEAQDLFIKRCQDCCDVQEPNNADCFECANYPILATLRGEHFKENVQGEDEK